MKNEDQEKSWEEEIFQYILGELSAEEANKLHDFLAEDEEAMNFYLDMQEVVARSRNEKVVEKEDLKLEDEQHKKLLAMAGFLTNATGGDETDTSSPLGQQSPLRPQEDNAEADANPANPPETAGLPGDSRNIFQTPFAKGLIQVAAAMVIVGVPLGAMIMPSLGKSQNLSSAVQEKSMAKEYSVNYQEPLDEIEVPPPALEALNEEQIEGDYNNSEIPAPAGSIKPYGLSASRRDADEDDAEVSELADANESYRLRKRGAFKENKKSQISYRRNKGEKRRKAKEIYYGVTKDIKPLNTPKFTTQSGAEATVQILQERQFAQPLEAPAIVHKSDIPSTPMVVAKSGSLGKKRKVPARYKVSADKKVKDEPSKVSLEASFLEINQNDMKEIDFVELAKQHKASAIECKLEPITKDEIKELGLERLLEKGKKSPEKKLANRESQVKASIEKAEVLFKQKKYDEAKKHANQALVLDIYDEKARETANRIEDRLLKENEKTRNTKRTKLRSETAWKWADSVKGKAEADEKLAQQKLSQTSYQLSDELYSSLKSADQKEVRQKLKALNLQLEENSEIQFNDAFNNVIISNSDDNRIQNAQKIAVLEKSIAKGKLQKEAQTLYKKAEKLYHNAQNKEAQQLLHQAMQKHNTVEMTKLLLKINAKLAKDSEVTLDKLLKLTAKDPLSTFSIDVDTASYTQVRNQINRGQMVKSESVRSEEFVNYFDYKYQAPKDKKFAIYSQLAPSEFHRGSQILRLAVQSQRPGSDLKRPSAFTFVIDTSGSMGEHNRLPLIRKVLPMILKQMKAQDRVTLITGNLKTHLLLDRVNVKNKTRIMPIIEGLQAGGPTDLEEMLLEAYDHAGKNYVAGAYNRVVLLSDGVANLGETAAQNILTKLKNNREKGIALTVVGMGRSQYNDPFLETLANKGDGNYLFIDSEEEARKAFVEKFSGIFHLVAKDVKIQVEFNPAKVLKYRQIGYDNRQLRHQDFRNDKVDAGEVGSGQSVTALYEVVLADKAAGDLGEVRLRYKDPHNNDAVTEMKQPIAQTDMRPTYAQADANYQLAVLTGQFAECLKGGVAQRAVQIKDILKKMRPLAARLSYDASVQELLKIMEKAQ